MKITVAALQLHLNLEHEAENIAAVSALVEQAAGKAGQYGAINAKDGVAPSAVQTKDN